MRTEMYAHRAHARQRAVHSARAASHEPAAQLGNPRLPLPPRAQSPRTRPEVAPQWPRRPRSAATWRCRSAARARPRGTTPDKGATQRNDFRRGRDDEDRPLPSHAVGGGTHVCAFLCELAGSGGIALCAGKTLSITSCDPVWSASGRSQAAVKGRHRGVCAAESHPGAFMI